jgi:hypothetical protein
MDILPSHKGSRVQQLIEAQGCELLCLSPYSSPDLNPIEEAFSKVKRRLRCSPTVRARQASVEEIGAPLDAIAAQEDVRGFFAPRLPHVAGQLLCQTVSSSVKAQSMNRPYVELYTSIRATRRHSALADSQLRSRCKLQPRTGET